MADVKADVIITQLTGGTQVVTGDLGGDTCQAALIYTNSATSKNIAVAGACPIWGYVANAQSGGYLTAPQYSWFSSILDAQTTSTSYYGHVVDGCLAIPDPASQSIIASAVATKIVDGLSLAWTGTPPTSYATFVLLSGADLDSHLFAQFLSILEPTGSVDVVTNFLSQLVVSNAVHKESNLLTAAATVRDNRLCSASMGVYPDSTSPNNQTVMSMTQRLGRTTQEVYAETHNDRVFQAIGSGTAQSGTLNIGAVTATQYTLTALGPTDARNPTTVSFNFGGNGVDVRTITAPATPQAQSVTGLGFTPTLLIVFSNNSGAYTFYSKTSTRNLLAVGIKKGSAAGGTHTVYATEAVSTTDCKSRFDDTVDYSGITGNGTHWSANITLDADGYTFDWQSFAFDGASSLHTVIAIEATLGGAPVSPTLDVQDASHSHQADALSLLAKYALSVADTQHQHVADEPVLTSTFPVASRGRTLTVQSRISSPEVTALAQRGVSPLASIEGDLTGIQVQLPLGVAAAIRSPRVRITENAGAVGTVVLQKNGVDTGVSITVGVSDTGWVVGSGLVSFLADDQMSWIFRPGANLGWDMLAYEIEAIDANTTLSLIGINSTSDNRLTDAGRYYFRPHGERDIAGLESDANMQLPVSGVYSNWTVATGQKTRTSTDVAGVRLAGIDSSLSVSINDQSSDQEVDYGSLAYTANQTLSYYVDVSTTQVTVAYEKMGGSFTTSNGRWLSILGDAYRDASATSQTFFYPIGGEMGRSLVEADAEVEIISDTVVETLFFRAINATTDPAYVTVRKNGVDTILRQVFTAPGHYDLTNQVLFNSGDTICFSVESGASGSVRMGYIGLVAYSVANGSVVLSPEDSEHSQQADTLALSAAYSLAVQDSQHTQQAESLTLSARYTLSLADTQHGHQADQIDLVTEGNLMVADADHGHQAENLDLGGAYLLTVEDTEHGQLAETIALSPPQYVLTVENASHGHLVDNIVLTAFYALSVNDATHSHEAERVKLEIPGQLVTQDATHGHQAEEPVLSGASSLIVDEAVHNHLAEAVSLIPKFSLAIADSQHGHAAQNVDLVAEGFLQVSEATHAQLAESMQLIFDAVLVIDDTEHAHLADGATLILGEIYVDDAKVMEVLLKPRTMVIEN